MNIIVFIWKGPLESLNQCISNSVNPSLSFKAFSAMLVIFTSVYQRDLYCPVFSKAVQLKKKKNNLRCPKLQCAAGLCSAGLCLECVFCVGACSGCVKVVGFSKIA